MLALSPDVVTVWTVALDPPPNVAHDLAALLSNDERQQAARFREPVDGARFTVRRATLRLLLADHLGQPPSEIEFGRGEYGKPFIARNPLHLQFSVSKSDARALIAIAQARPVGVDIERIEPLDVMGAVAARIFSADELASWRALTSAEQLSAFYAHWTRKEAVVKAIGRGLSLPLDQVTESSLPGWTAQGLAVADGYAAAIAAESNDWTVEIRDFNVWTNANPR